MTSDTSNEGFDHALIGVADLEDARDDYQRLGFTCCPRGRHIGWGTANYCIMFADDYLELLGIVDASQFTNNLDTFLTGPGEGLFGLSFASADIDALGAKLGREPSDLKRLLECPEGTVEPRFRLLHPPVGAMPGLSGFFCQHLTPELMRRPEWLAHANGATGIASATIAVQDAAEAARAYGKIFGARAVQPGQDSTDIVFNTGRMHIVQSGDTEGLVELAIRVADVAAAADYLDQADVFFAEQDDGLLIDPAEACGAFLRLVP